MAAGKNFDKLWTYGKGQLLLAGSFAPNGGSDPLASSIKGMLVKSVTRTSAGKWLVTARISVKDVIADLTSVRQVSNVDSVVQTGTFSNVGTAGLFTFVIRNVIATVETDPVGSPDANIRISFALVCQIGAIK